MKKCTYCGQFYPDDATICGVDGHSLETTTHEMRLQAPAPVAEPSPMRPEIKSLLTALGMLLIALVVFLARGLPCGTSYLNAGVIPAVVEPGSRVRVELAFQPEMLRGYWTGTLHKFAAHPVNTPEREVLQWEPGSLATQQKSWGSTLPNPGETIPADPGDWVWLEWSVPNDQRLRGKTLEYDVEATFVYARRPSDPVKVAPSGQKYYKQPDLYQFRNVSFQFSQRLSLRVATDEFVRSRRIWSGLAIILAAILAATGVAFSLPFVAWLRKQT